MVIDVFMMVSVCFHKDLGGPWRLFSFVISSPLFSRSTCHPRRKLPERWRKYSPSCNKHPVPGAASCEVQRVSKGPKVWSYGNLFLSKRHTYIARLGWFRGKRDKMQGWTTLVRCAIYVRIVCIHTHALREFELIVEYTAIHCST